MKNGWWRVLSILVLLASNILLQVELSREHRRVSSSTDLVGTLTKSLNASTKTLTDAHARLLKDKTQFEDDQRVLDLADKRLRINAVMIRRANAQLNLAARAIGELEGRCVPVQFASLERMSE